MRSGCQLCLWLVFVSLWPAWIIADDGTWIRSADGRWSDAANWSDGAIADGPGRTADFAALDIPRSVQVELDSSRTLGALKFADTNPSHGWTLASRRDRAVLTLSGDQPRISVQALATGKTVTLRVPLAGTAGFNKDGPGTLTLAGAVANSISGTVQVEEGELELGKPAGVVALAADNLHIGNGKTAAAVTLGAANQIPDTTDVTIFQDGILNLDGHSETINNLLDDGSGRGIVDGGSGEPLLTVCAGDFAGTIKNSAGKLTVNKSTRAAVQDRHCWFESRRPERRFRTERRPWLDYRHGRWRNYAHGKGFVQ